MQCATVAELSGRWNAGLMRYQRDTARPPQLSKIVDADFRTTRILPERSLLVPVAFPAGWLSSALFTSGPFCDATIQPWTPPMLAQFCPATETPGLDGWTPAAVRSLDAVSAKCLCALLDDCGIGLFPSFFAQARLVGLPKPGSLERRPLTILSVLYRVWASRMAAFMGTWMSARMPPEVYGARKGSSACDAGWRYTLLVDHARCSGVPLHCLAMDQKQRVDRLDLSQLEKLATAVGMPTMCIGALALYARLERHLVFGRTAHWTSSVVRFCVAFLRAVLCRSIGATWLAGCCMSAWVWTARDLMPSASWMTDCCRLATFWIWTQACCARPEWTPSLAPNWATTSCLTVVQGPRLAAFTLAAGIKYLGIDVTLRGWPSHTPRPASGCPLCALAPP